MTLIAGILSCWVISANIEWRSAQPKHLGLEQKPVGLHDRMGLAYHNVFDIAFETNRTIWFATSQGLVATDGVTRKRYSVEDGLPSNFVRCVVLDDANRLWVGTDRGAAIFDGQRFTPFSHNNQLQGQNIRRIVPDRQGNLWFCADSWPQLNPNEGGLSRWDGQQVTTYDTSDGLPSSYVVNFLDAGDDGRYAITDQGPAEWRDNRWQTLDPAVFKPEANWSSANAVYSPNLGVFISNGQDIFQRGSNGWSTLPNTPPHGYEITVCHKGRLWFAAKTGHSRYQVTRWDGSEFKPMAEPFVVGNLFFECIRFSPDQAIWLAGFGNVYRWRPKDRDWTTYGDLPVPQVRDAQGRLWGLANGELALYQNQHWQITEVPLGTQLLQDAAGQLWMYDRKQFCTVDLNNQSPPSHANDLGLAAFHAIHADKDSHLWLVGPGLDDPSTTQALHWSASEGILIRHSFPSETYKQSKPSPEKGLWLFTKNTNPTGHIRLLTETVERHVQVPGRMLAHFTDRLLFDPQGAPALGSDMGLFRWRPDLATWQKDERVGRDIFGGYTIAGSWWLASSGRLGYGGGIFRIDNDQIQVFEARPHWTKWQAETSQAHFGSMQELFVVDPTISGEPIRLIPPGEGAIQGVFADRPQSIWIKRDRHLLHYTPQKTSISLEYHGPPHILRQEGVQQLNVSARRPFDPRPSPNIRLQFRINDAAWQNVGRDQRIALDPMQLPTGEQTLELRALSPLSQDILANRQWTLSVEPPPIQTHPAFQISVLLALLALTLLSISLWHARSKLRRYSLGLESTVAERTAQLREDLTKRKAMEREVYELERRLLHAGKMESIGRLSGGIAHDFNNYLNVIMLYSDMAQSKLEQDPHTLPRYLEQIQKAGQRAADLTQQLLSFSRSRNERAQIFDVNLLVGEMVKLLARVLPEVIHLEWSPHPEPLTVRGDVNQIEQVLLNLAINARDAMPNGGQLQFQATQTDSLPHELASESTSSSAWAALTIRDTGIGIDQENLPKIFDPFFTTKTDRQGTGLGLSNTRDILKGHQGHIFADSTRGQGTTLNIYLPLCAQAEAVEKPARSSANGQNAIVLYESNRTLRELARDMLLNEGYRVECVADPDQLRETLLSCATADTIGIFDLGLNGEDVVSLITGLRQHRPDLRLIAWGDADRLATHGDTLKKHHVLAISKPLEPGKILAALAELKNQPSPTV